MATGNGDGATFSVFLRQPGGGFAEEAGSPFAAATSNGAVGDFNGDGRPDFAIAGFVGEGVARAAPQRGRRLHPRDDAATRRRA